MQSSLGRNPKACAKIQMKATELYFPKVLIGSLDCVASVSVEERVFRFFFSRIFFTLAVRFAHKSLRKRLLLRLNGALCYPVQGSFESVDAILNCYTQMKAIEQ